MTRQDALPQKQTTSKALRALPSVDKLLQALTSRNTEFGAQPHPPLRVSQAARSALQDARQAILDGREVNITLDALVAATDSRLHRSIQPVPSPVINATGVIINTNLGRAPLSDAASKAITAVAAGYSALEYDLEHGLRGSRQTPVRKLISELLGAQDALVVNNNAAALLVTLSALASNRDVVVSRGELVEIGGGFRIPDVLRQSGARLIETGTTNRTHSRDYEGAISDATALLLSVHPSNYRIVGFVTTPPLHELARIAHEHQLPLVHDLGSGALLRTEQWGLAHEPMPQESLAAGADLVCFSGDKLLGGPQAGIIAGKAELISRIEDHPLMRAVRIDKLTLATLAATLRAYSDGTAEAEIPIWQMISAPLSQIKARAEQWAATLQRAGNVAQVREGFSTIGGGSMPGETLPTWHCAIALTTANSPTPDNSGDAATLLAARLRGGQIPVIARILRDHILLDPRTVLPEQDDILLRTVQDALADG